MTEPHVSVLDIPAEARFIASARNFVADEARRCGWLDERRVDDLKLVVSESVTNSLRAQADRQLDDVVRIRVAVDADHLEVSVIDSGGGFELPEGPVGIPEPDPEREGGFGLPLIEALTDELHVSRSEDGTVMRVVVYRGADPADDRS